MIFTSIAGIFLAVGFLVITTYLFFFLAMFFLAGCSQPEIILENLTQKDANQVYVVLREHDIKAKKITQKERQKLSFKIAVAQQDAARALKLLLQNNLPKTWRFGLPEVFPPGSSNIIPTRSDEIARLHMAIQGEVESLIKLLPGIMDAKVVLAINTLSQKKATQNNKSASVTTLYRPLKNNSNTRPSDQEIRQLVASSIQGLVPEQVSVLQKVLTPIDYIFQPKPPQVTKQATYPPWILLLILFFTLTIILVYIILRFNIFKINFPKKDPA